MKGKKRGSSIIAVMAMSMFFMTIASIVVTSVVATLSSNDAEKGYEDLTYAAESGIEVAYSQIKLDNITAYPSNLDNRYLDPLKTEEVQSVVVEMNKDSVDNNKINLKSTAYGYKGAEKVVKSSLKITNTSGNTSPRAEDIFSNSLVAENNISIDSLGSFDMSDTEVSLGGAFTKPGSGGQGPTVKPQGFESAIFKPNVIKVPVVEADCIERSGYSPLISKAIDININGGTNVVNGIGKFRYTKSNSVSFDIIIVNADKLIIKNSNTWPMDEFNKVVICSGDVEIITNSGQTNKLTNSNIFAKNIVMSKPGSMHIVKAPAQNTTVSDQLNEDDLKKVDKILEKYIENWNSSSGGTGGGSGSGGSTTTVEFDDGSFEYE
ncbi:hypothetical protein [Clostridium sp.]|uniref:hypothetical protein n=1 Tax=Clostridium sp. TaxID=1506 RepID=UPI002FC83C37